MHKLMQVTKADGKTALSADVADVWHCDNLLLALWKSVEVEFNHVTMHPKATTHHSYRAQI